MAYKRLAMISPKMFREFMLPRYARWLAAQLDESGSSALLSHTTPVSDGASFRAKQSLFCPTSVLELRLSWPFRNLDKRVNHRLSDAFL
jgi:hypothetical protein